MPRVNLIFGPSWQNLLQWFNKPSPYSSQPLPIYLTWLKSKNWRLNEEAVQTVPSILDTQRVEGVTADSSRTAWQNDEPVVRRWKNTEQSVPPCCDLTSDENASSQRSKTSFFLWQCQPHGCNLNVNALKQNHNHDLFSSSLPTRPKYSLWNCCIRAASCESSLLPCVF